MVPTMGRVSTEGERGSKGVEWETWKRAVAVKRIGRGDLATDVKLITCLICQSRLLLSCPFFFFHLIIVFPLSHGAV
jgi:hypothetical protein